MILLCIFSCKKKDRYGNIQTLSEKKAATENKYDSVPSKNEVQIENIPHANCYDYLTELVRSSDFPFSDWNIQPNKVNLLIDHEDADSISCQLFYDTDGTGTIGWITYTRKDGKLLNTSANVENPVELPYNQKWKILFERCSSDSID